MKAGKRYFKRNRAGVVALVSGKLDLKTKTVKRESRTLYDNKWSVNLEGITITNTYVPENRAQKSMNEIMTESKEK